MGITMKPFTKGDRLKTALFALLPFALLLSFFSGGIPGNDFWWHVKAGEYICTHHAVPTTDVFSWWGTANGIPWTAHEWLSEVIYYALYALTGELGVFLFCLAAAAALTYLLYRMNRRDAGRCPLLTALFFSFFAVMTASYCFGRPHLFSYFLLLLELKLLFDFAADPSRKRIFFLPLLSVLWSNLHGGSSNLSYLLPLLFLLVGCCRFELGRLHADRLDKKARLTLAALTLLCVAAVFVNPIGVRVFLYPYQSLADGVSMTVISEWASPDPKVTVQLLQFFLPMALFSAFLFFDKEKPLRFIDLAVWACFLFLFLRSTRFSMLWYIAAPFCLFRYLPQTEDSPVDTRFGKSVYAAGCALLVLVSAGAIARTAATAKNDRLISVVLSDEAIEAVKADAPERLFNFYNYGEALIFHDIPTFYDARADLFSPCGVLGDGWDFNNVRGDHWTGDGEFSVEALIEKYGFDAVLTSRSSSLAVYMASHPERFTLLYEDDDTVYCRIVG